MPRSPRRGSTPRSVVEGVRLVRSGGRAPAALVEFYRTLFQVAASTSGAEVLIDSSNWPRYARFLREVAGTNLASLHLVRDPALRSTRACGVAGASG